MSALRAYMGYLSEPQYGACLIFAHNSRDAKNRAYKVMRSWFDGTDDEIFLDTRVRWLRHLPDHLRRLDIGRPQTIPVPPLCPVCESWGFCTPTKCDFADIL